MLKNYVKTALRNLSRNKAFSLINIFGLALGMAACLLIWQYVRFELSYDKFHSKADRLYRVTIDYYSDGEFVVSDVASHNTIGPLAYQDITGIENYARLFPLWSYSLASDVGKFANDIVMLADSSFTDLFDLEWMEGSPENALSGPYTGVLTEEMSAKYFPGQNALGKYIKYIDRDNDIDIKVTGVVESMPVNSHLHFDVLISRHTPLEDWGLEPNWDSNNEVTYILLDKNADPDPVATQLEGLLKKYQPHSNDRYVMQNIQDIHLYSHKTYELEENGNGRLVYALLGVSFFIVVIAWINFINLTTARAMERAKEVGIRKTMGSARIQLIKQFMMEALVLNTTALILALTLSQILSHPFSVFVDSDVTRYSVLSDGLLLMAMLFLFLFGCMATGFYPAIVLSSYQPVAILKGKFSGSKKGQGLRRSLVFFQYALATVLITGVIVFYKQYMFMQRQDLGMDIERSVVFRLPVVKNTGAADSTFHARIKTLKQRLLSYHQVKAVAVSESVPGHGIYELSSTRGLRRVGEPSNQNNYYFYRVDEDFFPLMNIRFAAGGNFQQGVANNDQRIINESARILLGFPDNASAIGEKIRWWGRDVEVIGVVKDHHHHSLDKTIDPILYWYSPGRNASWVTAKIKTSDFDETIRYIEQLYGEVMPDEHFDHHFLSDTYSGQYKSDKVMTRSFAAFSVLAIFIACLGLFGLSWFVISQRTKEIGIRKVLGASVISLCRLLTFRFLTLVGFAGLVVIPVTYYITHAWLERYAFKTELDWWIYLVPVIIMVLIAVITIASQTIRAASANPAESLKYE